MITPYKNSGVLVIVSSTLLPGCTEGLFPTVSPDRDGLSGVFSNPEAARQATLDELRQFLHKEKYGGKKLELKVLELYETFQASAATVDV